MQACAPPLLSAACMTGCICTCLGVQDLSSAASLLSVHSMQTPLGWASAGLAHMWPEWRGAQRAARLARAVASESSGVPGAAAQLERHLYAEVVPGSEAWGTALCAGTNFLVRADALQARPAAQQKG